MKILITAGELQERDKWLEFCNMKGVNVYALKEGLMTDDEEFTLTEEEAKELGLIYNGG